MYTCQSRLSQTVLRRFTSASPVVLSVFQNLMLVSRVVHVAAGDCIVNNYRLNSKNSQSSKGAHRI